MKGDKMEQIHFYLNIFGILFFAFAFMHRNSVNARDVFWGSVFFASFFTILWMITKEGWWINVIKYTVLVLFIAGLIFGLIILWNNRKNKKTGKLYPERFFYKDGWYAVNKDGSVVYGADVEGRRPFICKESEKWIGLFEKKHLGVTMNYEMNSWEETLCFARKTEHGDLRCAYGGRRLE